MIFYSLVSGEVLVSPLGLCLFFWSFSVFSLLCCVFFVASQ
jgi:hypothetical protein